MCAAWTRFLVLYCFLFFLASTASYSATSKYYYLTCDMCLRFRGCPVVLDIELSVSARHHKTRVLLCARRVLLLVAAAASGGVRHSSQNYMPGE